jgi:hypothetical protein
VHVALARDRRRVPQRLRRLADRLDDVAARLALRVARLEGAQRPVREHRARPRPEVLGGDVGAAGRIAQVLVDVLRADVAHLAIVVEVLQQVLAGQLLAAGDDPRQPPVAEVDLVRLAALAREPEPDPRPVDARVPVAEGGQPERLVEPRILLVPHPDQRQLQEPDDRRQDLLARQSGSAEIRVDTLADGRQQAGERDHPVELRALAMLAVGGVVAVLLAAAGIAPGRLKVAPRVRADPYVRPRGRDRERADAGEDGRVADRGAVRGAIGEAPARPAACDPGPRVGRPSEAGLGCRRAARVGIEGHRVLPGG